MYGLQERATAGSPWRATACLICLQCKPAAARNRIHQPVLTRALPCMCRRACIQEWAADELLSCSLADLLVMNDHLHAKLERWEQATQPRVLTQSKPMASVQVPAHLHCCAQLS